MADCPQPRARTWWLSALLFGSGGCALVYQTAWMREFRLIFGASTAASAAVLAIFIGGLGAGGVLFGSRADRHPRPVRLYSTLEAIVALSAAASPLLLASVRFAYLWLGGTSRLGTAGGTIVRLVLSALVLAIPTVAMGGTLPAASRGAVRQADARRQDVAALYALNTFGAVAGCLLSTFVLFELLGTRATVWLAAAVNLLVAMLARQLDRSAPATATVGPPPGSPGHAPVPLAFLLTASGVVGFVFFLMESVWYRMLGPLLGGSVFTFGLILALALAGIAAGSFVYAVRGADRPVTPTVFATTCLLEAALMAAAFAAGDRLAILAFVLVPLGQASFAAQIAGWSFVAAIVVLPASIVAGYQFPLLIAMFGRGREGVGRQIGLAYAANTAGAIVGSVAGGFGLLPWLSATGTWRLATFVLVGLGAAAVVLAPRRTGRALALPALLAGASVLLLLAKGPTAVWRDSGIGAGRAGTGAFASRNNLQSWVNFERGSVVWRADGVESSVALVKEPAGLAFIVNGKSDGSARTDAGTQVMLGLIGTILHPRPTRSLVIGLGTGSTAGWLGTVPSMERVDVVELEPLVLEVARACRAVNRDVMDNPKVHITIGDAREALLTSHEQYDVIASEPSNPFRAGVASLFTREYYEAARERLSDDGLFVQWVQAYEIDARTLRTVYATLGSVFPSVETWQTTHGDLALVAGRHPIAYRAAALRARLAEEPYREALAYAWRAVDLHGFLAHFVAGDRLTRAMTSARFMDVNTDDRNVVEFGFARSVGRGATLVEQLLVLSTGLGASRPAIDDSAIPWSQVDTAWVSFLASEGRYTRAAAATAGEEQMRQTALGAYYGNNDADTAWRAWTTHRGAPRDPTELAMLADITARAGSDQALTYIEALRPLGTGEAEFFLAELRNAQGDPTAAAAALEAALARFRENPWALTRFKELAIELAGTLIGRQPALAPGLHASLKPGLAVRAFESDRLVMLARAAFAAGRQDLCVEAVDELEPSVPWTENFLTLRRDCYAASGDVRVEVANRELLAFLVAQGMPLSAGVAAPAR